MRPPAGRAALLGAAVALAAAAVLVAIAIARVVADASSRDAPSDPRALVLLGVAAGALVLAATLALALGRRR